MVFTRTFFSKKKKFPVPDFGLPKNTRAAKPPEKIFGARAARAKNDLQNRLESARARRARTKKIAKIGIFGSYVTS